jgi:hypothetical protein
LVNPKNNKTGRVEIYHPSFGWGTACGVFHWTIVEGGVVCCQLNFTGVKAVNNYYGKEVVQYCFTTLSALVTNHTYGNAQSPWMECALLYVGVDCY